MKSSNLGSLGDKIKQSSFGKLKKLAFLDYSVRQCANKILTSLGLDENDLQQIQTFVKYNAEIDLLSIKITSINRTVLAFLKTNISIFEAELKAESFNVDKLELSVS